MIQFLGVQLCAESASVAILGRDLSITARSTAPMLNASKNSATGVTEVPPAEWVRAGGYALQEAYFQLPVKMRKPWGIGLAGPSGWIALDVDYKPLSSVRITSGVPVLEDLASWIEQNPAKANHIHVVLFPKDYFRFAISGGLAADATHASRLGLLHNRQTQWSQSSVLDQALTLSRLPPVFDCHVRTGRLSEEGMRQSCLPGGTWMVAGAHEAEAALLAGGDLRTRTLWILEKSRTCALGVAGTGPLAPPEGWRLVRSPMAGHSILEQTCESGADEPGKAAGALEAAGFTVDAVTASRGAPEEGAALLAAIGSGLLKSWDPYYKAR